MRTIYPYSEVVEWPQFISRFIGRISIILVILLCIGSMLFTLARFASWEHQPHKAPAHAVKHVRPVVLTHHF